MTLKRWRTASSPSSRSIASPSAAPRLSDEIPEPRLEVEVTGPVDLAAIAGGEKKCGAAGRGLALKPGGHFSGSESEPLPQLDAGRMMAYANDMERQIPEHAIR